jgi:hypothetical protein
MAAPHNHFDAEKGLHVNIRSLSLTFNAILRAPSHRKGSAAADGTKVAPYLCPWIPPQARGQIYAHALTRFPMYARLRH